MYDHYIAFDWAQSIVAIARMSGKSKKIHTFETRPDVKELKVYLRSLRGKKALTIEESTTSQWLYIEFKDCVDELIICDPRRNRLLQEGAKNDRIDACKLVTLLRADLLKPVFHSADQFIYLRKLISGYQDLIKSGVRLKNQRSALCRATGICKEAEILENPTDQFVLDTIDERIQLYEAQRKRYTDEFTRLRRKHRSIANLCTIPGIGEVNAVKIAAIVVDARRFRTKGRFLSYCGLVKLDKISGNRSYGKKDPQYDRTMKDVFKTAAMTNLRGESCFNAYYKSLIKEKGYPEHQARHAVSRRIATLAYGVLKSGKKLDVTRFEKTEL